jgi:putative PIN family toxin of toxin-antitoxin system
MRVALDTDVMVAALRSDRGASRELVRMAVDQKFDLLLSVPLVIEYEAVLTRPEQLTASKLRVGEVGTVLDMLVSVARPVRLSFRWRPVLGDPSDDMVLETAVNGGAELLVTFNHRHFSVAAHEFQLEVVSPAQALEHLRR